ncbi:MAG: methyltransferase domain-containing protein [Halobacteriales archaeon]
MEPEGVTVAGTYICPSCGAALENGDALVCPACDAVYPDNGGFYDFLGDEEPSNDGLVSLFDAVSRIYETPLWYPAGMRLATGGRASADQLVERVAERVAEEGAEKVLDVATGTGLFARRLARDATVYGVDASAEMLRRAVRNARRNGVTLELARADAGALPYADASFDAATCTGALHLLPDPAEAVTEAGRAVRSGGALVVTTLVDGGVFRSRAAQRIAALYGMKVFDAGELDEVLDGAGFERVETRRNSSLVTVTARRR